MQVLTTTEIKGAYISEDGRYRYKLWRIWDESKPKILFIMLNPSTADANEDDPTIRRVKEFAKSWGYGGILIGNVYAIRATDPKQIKEAENPCGAVNKMCLHEMAKQAKTIVFAWGAYNFEVTGKPNLPETILLKNVWCLGKNKDGSPKHPLYLAKNAKLERF